jgi:hypothetical protein
MSNWDHTAFLATQLRDGAIILSFDKKGSTKEVVVKTKDSLYDGNWHTVRVSKAKQRITVTVDGNSEKGAKISKVLKVDIPLLVGGVPKEYYPLMNKDIVSTNELQYIFLKTDGLLKELLQYFRQLARILASMQMSVNPDQM